MSTLKKLWQMLNTAQRRAAVELLLLMLVGVVLETLSIGLIIPAMGLITRIDSVANYPFVISLLQMFGNPTSELVVVVGMLVLVIVFAFKTLFLAFLAWRQMRFIFMMQADISQRLFAGYLRQPYTFHLQHNSSELIRNTTTEMAIFIGNGLMPGMLILTELSVLVGLSVLLIAVEPIGAIAVVVTLSIAGLGFYRLTRNRILRWGQARQYHEGLRIQRLQEGLGSAKDVKLLGREDDFLAQYHIHNYASAHVGIRQSTIQALPRLWLEFLAVISLAALVIIMLWQGRPIATAVASLGLFVAAAFRIMPSVNRVLSAVQSVHYALPTIDTLHDELLSVDTTQIPQSHVPLPLRTVLILDNANYCYPAAVTKALDGVSLTIPCGAAVGFVGSSGAGKSTLVDVILGLLTLDSGIVYVDGVDIQTNIRGWQDQIGYVPQSIFLTDDTLRRNVAFGLANDQIDEAAVWHALRAAQLDDFVNTLPQGLDTIVGERGVRLSGGQRQRIGIARALYHDPSVLVLDEATSALDTTTERGVMDAVRALHGNKTVLIVAHRFSTVEYCDQLFRLENGKIVDDKLKLDTSIIPSILTHK